MNSKKPHKRCAVIAEQSEENKELPRLDKCLAVYPAKGEHTAAEIAFNLEDVNSDEKHD